MSQTLTRSTREIQAEYSNSCLKAGNLQYELVCKNKDLDILNERLRDLNFEYVAAQNLEAEVAKKVAEEKKTAETPALEIVKENSNVQS